MTYIDSDILIDILKGEKTIIKKFEILATKDLSIKTTTINSFELFKGAYRSQKKEQNLILVNELLKNLDIKEFTFGASKTAAKIFSEISSKGEIIDIADQMIASIVISDNDILITRNKRHFERILGLKLEVW